MSDNNTLLLITNDKQTVSARVNSYIVDIYKKNDIPLSLVIENSLINFLKLSDTEKLKFLSQNLPENVKIEDIKPVNKKWKDMLLDYFKLFNIPSSVSAGLLTGICIGAVGLIGGAITAFGDKIFNEK